MSYNRRLEKAENELEYQLELGNITIPEFNRKLNELKRSIASEVKQKRRDTKHAFDLTDEDDE